MSSLKFTLTTLAPVIFTQSGGDSNTADTLLYVPGSAILGLLANRFIQKQKLGSEAHLNTDFSEWFLHAGLSFSPAYLIGQTETRTGIAFPAPMSVQRSKESSSSTCLNTIHLDESELPLEPLQALGGFLWTYSDGDISTIRQVQPQTSLHFHHGRNANGETVPFTYVSVNANQTFVGTIRGSMKDLKRLRESVGEQFEARAGRSRSAQYGQVRFSFDELETEPEYTALRAGEQITMTLQSDLILLNNFGFPSPEISTLETYLPGLRIVRQLSQAVRLETHVGVWGLRRSSEYALKAGSVFLLEASETIPSTTLQKIAHDGLGERLNEGHGRIAFGYLEEEIKLADSKPITATKPKGSPPELVRQLLQAGFIQSLEQLVEAQALKKAREFASGSTHLIPRSSLLGRLETWSRLGNRKRFEENVKKLRDTAHRQLDKCRSESKTLRDLFENLDEFAIQRIIESHQNRYRSSFSKLELSLPDVNLESYELEAVRLMLIQLRKLRQTGEKKGTSHA